jgi:beta-galactosidase
VKNLLEDYIKPQENGSHVDCDYVMLQQEAEKAFSGVREEAVCAISGDRAESAKESGTACTIACFSPKAFSFNASMYTQEEMTEKKHNYELKEADGVVLCLDYAMNGIGSNSGGPQLLDKYRFDDTEFTYEMTILPSKGDKLCLRKKSDKN